MPKSAAKRRQPRRLPPLTSPMKHRGQAEVVEAYRPNVLPDAHRDDGAFGYRLLANEAAEAGEPMCRRTAWRICRDNQWYSASGVKQGENRKRPGPPGHDHLVERDFTADDVNELCLADIPPQAGGAHEFRTSNGRETPYSSRRYTLISPAM